MIGSKNAAMTTNAAVLLPGQTIRHNGAEFVVKGVVSSYRKGQVTIHCEDGSKIVVGARQTVEVVA